MAARVQWDRSPAMLAKAMEQWVELVDSRIGRVAMEEGMAAEAWMKENRPWNDITGNARRGLRVRVTKENQGHIMWFIHSAEYGVYLELARGGTYAVIMPGIRVTIPRLRRALTGVASVR